MILESLVKYNRKYGTVPYGCELKSLKYLIEIDSDGSYVGIVPLSSGEGGGKKDSGVRYIAPASVIRSGINSWQYASLLCDDWTYVLGAAKHDGESPEKAEGRLKAFVAKIEALPDCLKVDEGIAAVLRFYRGGGVEKVKESPGYAEIAATGGNVTYRLKTSAHPVFCSPALIDWLSHPAPSADAVTGICLATGERGEIARIHGKITAGSKDRATLVGAQTNSGYDSYGKEQGYNSPVSVQAAHDYITAIRTMLRSGENHVYAGGMVYLMWPETPEGAPEADLPVLSIFDAARDAARDGAEQEPGAHPVKDAFAAARSGISPAYTGGYYCVLGLQQNRARLAVKYWMRGPIKDVAGNVLRHLDDISVAGGYRYRVTTVRDILRAAALDGDEDKISSNIAADLAGAIFRGTPYPRALYMRIIDRARAEKKVTSVRAGYIKAYLTRFGGTNGGLGLTLDKNRESAAYRIGRLLAVAEKLQRDAAPGLNNTVADKYLRQASTAPAPVVPALLRGAGYRMKHLAPNRRVYYNRLITEILAPEQMTIPQTLTAEEQGEFFLGYYHQMQDLYTKKDAKLVADEGSDGCGIPGASA